MTEQESSPALGFENSSRALSVPINPVEINRQLSKETENTQLFLSSSYDKKVDSGKLLASQRVMASGRP